jgi:hypothetical protein
MPLDPSQARKKARQLIAQAVDDSVTVEEARSFAMRAAHLIEEHDLLAEPFDPSSVIGGMSGPEVGEALSSVMDLVGRVQKSGIVDALKRTVRAGKQVRERARERGPRRRQRD